MRFVREGTVWRPDAAGRRAPGRGAYLCSERCAARVVKNKRFPGLSDAASAVSWKRRTALGGTEAGRV
jgi:predicted RNA-binding protein YlxR (DUF448 family)